MRSLRTSCTISIEFLTKLLRKSDMSVVAYCQSSFPVDLPTVVIKRLLGKKIEYDRPIDRLLYFFFFLFPS